MVLLTSDELQILVEKAVISAISQTAKSTADPIEIIDGNELCVRLNISLATLIRYRRKGKIPFLLLGDSIRYDWHKVLKSITK